MLPLAAVAAGALLAGSPAAGAGGERLTALTAQNGEAEAVIRRTAYGVPHILADDFEGLGYGFGYAFAEDNICTIAESYVTVNAERSKHFGEGNSWNFRGNGSTANNLDSDFFYKRINESGVIERLLSMPVDEGGPRPQIRDGVRGYVRGYNRYLRETGVDRLPDPRCRGKEWVRPITEMDAYRRFYQLASLASQGVAIDGIGGAQPPGGGQAAAKARQRRALEGLGPDSLQLPIGSNAYGLGRDGTDNGRGMVLGNPHFPWDGAERLYQVQLTIPGQVNVSGGTLYGVPLVLIGSTDGMAWSHTVATAFRFTPVELTLAPGDPTSYIVDGQVKQMESTELTVDVGGGETRTRTLYRTEYGPMFTEILGLPLFPWTPAKAFAMRDVNEENFRYLNHFFDTNMAQSVREYDAIQQRWQGIPWVNSVAADKDGEAYYSMDGAIPNVPDAKVQSCAGALNAATFNALGLPTLDGSRKACDWDDARGEGAAAPGIFPPSKIPRLFRGDYTHNGNDSHWLTNPRQPLEGYARIIGNERTQRSLRTRIGLVQAEQRLAGQDGRPGNRFSIDDLKDISLGNRQYAGELWRDRLVEMCSANPVMLGTSGPVNVSEACPVLAAWDVRDELDSRGAILFRRFATRILGSPGGPPYTQPFNPNDAVNTPSGINTNDPRTRQSFADAVSDLRGAGIPLDAPLRDHQYEKRGEERIPIHGGPGTVGVFNAINVSWNPPAGYGDVPHGSSFIMATRFTGSSCPVDMHTFVTYGNSENPDSPHNSDYTRAFSEKRWNDVPYCEDEILGHPDLRVTELVATAADCRDTAKPRTRLKRRGVRRRGQRVALRGRSRDRGTDCTSGVRRVQVSLARVGGEGCRFLRSRTRYRLTERRSCRRPVMFRARGRAGWRSSYKRLRPGKYRVQARAVDRRGNKERPRRRSIVKFRVR